ncbi:MAG: type II toxin-antitoxin system VapC family toxin [Anaerolineales bacterium]|jgi:predicted nucleic acid-binding protein
MSPQAIEKSFFVLDASVWVSRLVSQDGFHAAVKSWMEEKREAGVQFISPALLLAEVGGAISRRTGDPVLAKKAITQLENLPGLRLVEMDNELVRQAAKLAAELGLRGADCMYVAVACQLDLPLVTFDVDQHQRAGERIAVHFIE